MIVHNQNQKGEDGTCQKVGKYSQDQSYVSGALFVSLGRFPVDFCGASQLPAWPGENFTFS